MVEVNMAQLIQVLTVQRNDLANEAAVALAKVHMLEEQVPSEQLLSSVRELAVVHICDGDELGVLAKKILLALDKQYPQIKELQDRS